MRPLFCRLLCLGVLAASATPLQAQSKPDSARVNAAQRMLQASGAAELMAASIKASIPAQRTAMPQVPAAFWERFEERITLETPMFLDSIAVLYAATFSLAELQQLTAFYESPLGRRLRSAQSELTTQSSRIGQRWGERMGAAVAATLQR